ncbi:hypothetical protein LINPERPRIM_LOCUS8782 [Linum perenne]
MIHGCLSFRNLMANTFPLVTRIIVRSCSGLNLHPRFLRNSFVSIAVGWITLRSHS